ncbi:MAG: hypothetical protein HQL38_01600 [Alphaproteobacteria bacterium]|nr:hypothetical protein [Alphaproteobacteria bacterium]
MGAFAILGFFAVSAGLVAFVSKLHTEALRRKAHEQRKFLADFAVSVDKVLMRIEPRKAVPAAWKRHVERVVEQATVNADWANAETVLAGRAEVLADEYIPDPTKEDDRNALLEDMKRFAVARLFEARAQATAQEVVSDNSPSFPVPAIGRIGERPERREPTFGVAAPAGLKLVVNNSH